MEGLFHKKSIYSFHDYKHCIIVEISAGSNIEECLLSKCHPLGPADDVPAT